MLRSIFVAALSIILAASAFAAPVSIKELDLLVRMRTPDQEILRELDQRRLLAPLDAASEQMLIKNGATPDLIQHIKTGNFTVPVEDAIRLQQRQELQRSVIAKENAADAAAFAARQQQQQRIAAPVSDTMRKLFDGKLVRMENGDLRPYSADELRNVRYYALYYSAHWCAPCRQFTPHLVEFYKRFKAQHPEFEIIFVSNDHNPAGMQTYMKSFGMPWPAVKFEQIDSKLQSLAGKGIPWLGIFNDAGEPVSSNGRTKQWVDPNLILQSFERALTPSTTAKKP